MKRLIPVIALLAALVTVSAWATDVVYNGDVGVLTAGNTAYVGAGKSVPERTVKSVRVLAGAGAKSYKIIGATSGNLLFETYGVSSSTGTTATATTSVEFTIPSEGLKLISDDSTATVYLYTGRR